MAKCDLCGNDCAAHHLKQLRESYRTIGIEDLCPAYKCENCCRKHHGQSVVLARTRFEAADWRVSRHRFQTHKTNRVAPKLTGTKSIKQHAGNGERKMK